MFKVIVKNDKTITRNVYSVNVTDDGFTWFLIWYMGKWMWAESSDYIPVRGKEHPTKIKLREC